MAEYYLSHEPRIIVAEIPSDEPPPPVAAPLEAEEWVRGWLVTAPANPWRTKEIMGGLAAVAGRLPEATLLLYPYDAGSLADVVANWLEGLEGDPNIPLFLQEEVEDNAAGFRNLLLGEKTLWKAMRELLEGLPGGRAALPPIEAHEALLEEALADFEKAARRGVEALPPATVHAFGTTARRLLVGEKREALRRVVATLTREAGP